MDLWSLVGKGVVTTRNRKLTAIEFCIEPYSLRLGGVRNVGVVTLGCQKCRCFYFSVTEMWVFLF
jgi:hypothetical protein